MKMTDEELGLARRVADALNPEKTSTAHRLLGHIAAQTAEVMTEHTAHVEADVDLAEAMREAEALRGEVARLTVERDAARGARDRWEKVAAGNERVAGEQRARAERAEAAHAELSNRIDRWCDTLADALPAGVRVSNPEEALAVLRGRALELVAERETYKRDFEAEIAGAKALRLKHGARDDETFMEFVARLAASESHLAAIRQRAEHPDPKALEQAYWDSKWLGRGSMPSDEAAEAHRRGLLAVARYILGDDAPSEMDGLRGEMAEKPHSHSYMAGCNASCPPPAERTTAEAFDNLHRALAGGYSTVPPLYTKSLSLLERRVGEMDNALRRLLWDEGHARGCVDVRRSDGECMSECALARAALTDAPPGFTLEEIRGVCDRVTAPLTTEDVVNGLLAIRSHP